MAGNQSACLAALLLISAAVVISGRAETLQLAQDGTTTYQIVSPSTATPAEQFAAEELALFLGKVTGAEFPIVEGGAHNGPAIHIGWTERAKAAGIDFEQLGDEEWVLKTEGRDLILAGGRPRGTLYAVYEFLESHAGCRWVSHDLERIPKDPNLMIPPLDERGNPAFRWRELGLYARHDEGPDHIAKEDYALFLVRNRYSAGPHWLDEPRFGFASRYGSPGGSHTFFHYQKDWEEVKPEYFAMREDGTRAPRPKTPGGYEFDLTNRELRDRMFEQLLEFIDSDKRVAEETGRPAPKVYALAQNDSLTQVCRSPETLALVEREGSYSGWMLDFVNDIARRVAPSHPEIELLTEAYRYTRQPPRLLRPELNVTVRLHLLDREYGPQEISDVLRPLSASTNQEARKLTEAWAKSAPPGRLAVKDYAVALRVPFRHPYDTTVKILANLEFWNGLGIDSVMIDSSGIDVSFRPLRDWLFFKKAVNPQLLNDQLLDEFFPVYFGPSAVPMRKVYDRIVETTLSGDRPHAELPPAVNPALNADFFVKVNEWLDEAELLAQGKENAKYLRNVRYERVPVDSALLHLWHRFGPHPAFANTKNPKQEVLARYEQNKRLLIATWSTSVHHMVHYGRDAFDSELAMLRAEMPEQFIGTNAAIRLLAPTLLGISPSDAVEDPDAVGGISRRFVAPASPDCRPVPQFRVYDALTGHSGELIALGRVPQDEAYHWVSLGVHPVGGGSAIWSNLGINIPLGWGALPPPSNEMEVWVSMKFTGPIYVEDSTQPDQVLIDRVVIVPPPHPVREISP